MTTAAGIAAEAVDGVFDTFGTAAAYAPPLGATAIACTVLRMQPDQVVPLGESRGVIRGDVVKVRASEIPAPVKNGVFSIDGATLTVIADPVSDDPQRLVWTCTVR